MNREIEIELCTQWILWWTDHANKDEPFIFFNNSDCQNELKLSDFRPEVQTKLLQFWNIMHHIYRSTIYEKPERLITLKDYRRIASIQYNPDTPNCAKITFLDGSISENVSLLRIATSNLSIRHNLAYSRYKDWIKYGQGQGHLSQHELLPNSKLLGPEWPETFRDKQQISAALSEINYHNAPYLTALITRAVFERYRFLYPKASLVEVAPGYVIIHEPFIMTESRLALFWSSFFWSNNETFADYLYRFKTQAKYAFCMGMHPRLGAVSPLFRRLGAWNFESRVDHIIFELAGLNSNNIRTKAHKRPRPTVLS
jgi:hypothetical protein